MAFWFKKWRNNKVEETAEAEETSEAEITGKAEEPEEHAESEAQEETERTEENAVEFVENEGRCGDNRSSGNPWRLRKRPRKR